MGDLKPIAGLTRTAVIIVWAYLAMELLWGAFSIMEFASGDYSAEGLRPLDLVGLLFFPVIIGCYVVVGRWIYVANWNAHRLSDDMSISPGWSVGWFFVPVANLFKPFQAMKECWMASHNQWDSYSEPPPPLLGWWWGLWIVVNIVTNISFRLSTADGSVTGAILALDLAAAALTVPLCYSLVTIMQRVAAAQRATRHAEVFA